MCYTEVMFKGYMTTEEAAEYLGISPAGVRQHLRRGNITGEKIGTTWLISVEELKKIKGAKRGRPPGKDKDSA